MERIAFHRSSGETFVEGHTILQANALTPPRSGWSRFGRRLYSILDTRTAEQIFEEEGDHRSRFARLSSFIVLHGACLSVIWTGWSWTAAAFALFLYVARMFAITGFYHRYFSHRTFKTNRFWQFIFAMWGNSAAQRGPLWWAAHHRKHHRHSDTPEDVHSPWQRTLYEAHMGWIVESRNHKTDLREIRDFARYPELVFLNRFDMLVPIVLGTLSFLFGWYLEASFPGLGTTKWQMLTWFFISTVVLFHGTCTINSLSHLFGRKRYNTSDQSRNSLILALITLGEGWHNNHHYYPGATRQGFYWWEIDITYYGLRVLQALGIISRLNPVPLRARESNHLAAA